MAIHNSSGEYILTVDCISSATFRVTMPSMPHLEAVIVMIPSSKSPDKSVRAEGVQWQEILGQHGIICEGRRKNKEKSHVVGRRESN